jgi:hypothetical protein
MMYYFNVRTGASDMLDPEGTELPDLTAARVHAVEVARELLKSDEVKKRPWRLDVCDRRGAPMVQVLFSTVDSSLDHLESGTRELIERLSESRRRLAETMFKSQSLLQQSRKARAEIARKPYLIAIAGRRVA